MIGHRLGLIAASALIDANLVAALAAQQSVHRNANHFAQNVPQRMFDAADGRIDHKSPGKPGEVHHHPPQVFDVPRVLTSQPAFEIVDGRHGGVVRPAGISFANAMNSLICLDLHEYQVAASHTDHERLDV